MFCPPLRTDLARLAALETFLGLQLAAVREQIEVQERAAGGWLSRPARSYRIVHHPAPAALPGRGELHRDDCPRQAGPAGESTGFGPDAARDALVDTHSPITPCGLCQPELVLLDRAPATYRLQKFRTSDNREQRYYLHTSTCVVTEGEKIDAAAATSALERDDVDACDGCHPENELTGAAPPRR